MMTFNRVTLAARAVALVGSSLMALALFASAGRAAATSLPVAAPADTHSAPAAKAQPPALIVDDDGQQCAGADATSVQAAIERAAPGAVVQVCPGVYTEFVTIDKPLTLRGQVDAVAGFDCFNGTPSSDLALDPTKYAILNRPRDTRGNLVSVAAGSAAVTGLVLQGATSPADAPNPVDAAVNLQSGSAGARVHHNLFRLNSLGIDLGSDGSATTRVDHNCLRGDVPNDGDIRGTWGMTSQRQDFVGGLVDHNETFQHAIFAYGVGDEASTRQAVFKENVSRADGRRFAAFGVLDSSSSSIIGNDIEPAATGIDVLSGNNNLRILGNHIHTATGAGSGVLFQVFPGATSKQALVAENTISGFRLGAASAGIAAATNADGAAAIDGLKIADNTLTTNRFGITVQLTNTGIQVSGNTANDNTQIGIRALLQAGRTNTGASFTDNTMLRNGVLDALDQDRGNNFWANNVCVNDNPADLCPPE